MARSALEVVTVYIRDIWNKGEIGLIPEICADPVIRHDANTVTQLTHAEQAERIRHNYDELRPFFEEVVFAGDDEHVTLVWNVTGRDPNWKWCGIEIFRVVDGRIVEVWNSPYVDGRWSMSRTLSSVIAGAETDLPVMTLDIAGTTVEATMPVDARNIGRWIAQALGEPEALRQDGGLWRHVHSGGTISPAGLVMRDPQSAAVALDAVGIDELHIELARSGLVNARVVGSGTRVEAPSPATPAPAPEVVRLSEPFGSLKRDADIVARVVGATISIGGDAPRASGQVTLRVAAGSDPHRALGAGALSFGWRAGDFLLSFEGEVRLDGITNQFTDDEGTEFSCRWETDLISAIIVNDLPSSATAPLARESNRI